MAAAAVDLWWWFPQVPATSCGTNTFRLFWRHPVPAAVHLPASSSSTRIFKFRLFLHQCGVIPRQCTVELGHAGVITLRANWWPHLLLYVWPFCRCFHDVVSELCRDGRDWLFITVWLYDFIVLYCNAKLGIYGVGSPTGSPRAWHREMSLFWQGEL